MKRTLNAYQLASKIGCSGMTIYNWVDKGLPHEVQKKGLRDVKKFNYEEVMQWAIEHGFLEGR